MLARVVPMPMPALAPIERLAVLDGSEEGWELEEGSGIDEVGVEVAALLAHRARSLCCHAIWIVGA